jgi:hypothetical protein
MALKPELESWLKQVSAKASPELSALLTKELEKDELATVWKDTVMARSDYSRAQDELRKEGEKLTAEANQRKHEAEALLKANTDWRTTNVAAYEQALKAKEQADAELTLHRAKIKTLAEQGLIDPNDPSLIVSNQQVVKKEEPKVNHLTQEAFEAELAKREMSYVKGMTYFEDLADEHFQLTGQRLKRTELVTELEKSPGLSLQQVWEKKYNIPQIKADLAEKQIQERIAKEVAESIAKDRSERATDVHAFRPRELDSDGENKHILSLFQNQTNATQASDAVRAAKASWERGEFRTPTAKPA